MIFIRSFPKTPIVEWYKYLFYCKAQIDGNNNDIKLSLQISIKILSYVSTLKELPRP